MFAAALWSCAAVLGAAAPAAVTVRRYVLSEDPTHFDTEEDNGWVNETLQLNPANTALVMVDVWDDHTDPILSENERLRLLPLLDAARKAGMLIIHAPSEAPEWSNISVLPGEVLVVGTNGTTGSSSRCDTAIRAHPTRQITTVLMAGYDTNRCIVDKPCGAVGLSTELAGMAEVLLVRDVTRGQYTTVENPWYGHLASINMLELGWWLSSGITHPDIANTAGSPAPRPDHAQQQTDPTPRRGLRSLELSDLLAGLGMPAAAAALQPLRYPVPAANQSLEQPNPVPSGAAGTGAALVVVSCSGDYHNDGFRARVMENRATVLEPLLAAVRSVSTATIIHVPNGHTPDGACVPLPGELVATSTATFDALVKANSIGTLLYAGYGANTDVLFGDGGMARYYSAARYLGEAVPAYGWVQGATIAVETPDTLGDRWAEKLAVAYRNAPVVTPSDVVSAVCSGAPSAGPVFYRLPGLRHFASSADVVVDTLIDGTCGPSMLDHAAVTLSLTASVADLSLTGRKALCFVKSVGTPYAVFQIRLGDTNGSTLEYQTAQPDGWTTLSVPNFFVATNVTHRIDVVHNGTEVAVYRDGVAVGTATMPALDYGSAKALIVGARKVATEFWVGELGDVLLRAGAYPPTPSAGTGLLPAERAALLDIHDRCGGAQWSYAIGTDAVGGGQPWGMGDPCSAGWFGVKCDTAGTHVLQLFPNTRFSGNPLEGCELPVSLGALTMLEHFYASNDRTPSHLVGQIPPVLGTLTHLKCLYLSHTGVSGAIPRELESLNNLEVFLMRANNLTGPLIDFGKLPHLKNVWFDSQPLSGNLSALGGLNNLTFLQASGTNISGPVPARLCNIDCNAAGTEVTCDKSLPSGCCDMANCGTGPKAPAPPPATMGDCFPQ